jgi:hypothetical protein
MSAVGVVKSGSGGELGSDAFTALSAFILRKRSLTHSPWASAHLPVTSGTEYVSRLALVGYSECQTSAKRLT